MCPFICNFFEKAKQNYIKNQNSPSNTTICYKTSQKNNRRNKLHNSLYAAHEIEPPRKIVKIEHNKVRFQPTINSELNLFW